MNKYFLILFIALLCGNSTMASTTELLITDSGGVFTFNPDLVIAEFSGSTGAGTLEFSSSDPGLSDMSLSDLGLSDQGSSNLESSTFGSSNQNLNQFVLSIGTENTQMVFSNSELILQIAETIVVSGEFVDGSYLVNSVHYNWASCETIQGNEFCNNFIAIGGNSGTLTQIGNVFSITTSASVLLLGYSFSEIGPIARQFEFTQVPLPTALWFFVSALSSLFAFNRFTRKQNRSRPHCSSHNINTRFAL